MDNAASALETFIPERTQQALVSMFNRLSPLDQCTLKLACIGAPVGSHDVLAFALATDEVARLAPTVFSFCFGVTNLLLALPSSVIRVLPRTSTVAVPKRPADKTTTIRSQLPFLAWQNEDGLRCGRSPRRTRLSRRTAGELLCSRRACPVACHAASSSLSRAARTPGACVAVL